MTTALPEYHDDDSRAPLGNSDDDRIDPLGRRLRRQVAR